jgi:SH3-like domain-containing protein
MVRYTILAALLALPAGAAAAAPPPEHHPVPHHEHHEAREPHHHHAPPAHPTTVPVVHPRHQPPRHPVAAPPAPPAVAPAPAAPAAPVAPPEPAKGTSTGLPLPRFASLKTDDVNLRSGPGLRYPIQWVYKRRDLPVEIEREFEVWRLVADSEGVKGWVHQATLVGRRTFVVVGAEQTIRSAARDDANPVARLKPGVIGRIRSCDANAPWCQVQVGDYRGWLKREAFWGTYPTEAIQP